MVKQAMIDEAIRAMRERGHTDFTEADARAVWEAMEAASHWRQADAERN